MLIELNPQQTAQLKKTADYCFSQGYTSTQFARAIALAAFLININIPSSDDFYNMTAQSCNVSMKEVLHQLGYGVSSYGYGIYKHNHNYPTVYSSPSESTWN